MPTFKIDFQFREGANGWTETWYAPNFGSKQLAITAGLRVGRMRRSCLGKLAFLTHYVVNDMSGASGVVKIPMGGPDFVPPPEGADAPWNAVRLRVVGGDGHYVRTTYIRGVSDDQLNWTAQGVPVVGPGLSDALIAFLQSLATQGLAFRAITRDKGLNQRKKITGVGPHASGVVQITCPAHGFNVSQVVNISRVNGQNFKQVAPGRKAVNGNWQVSEVLDFNNFLIPLPLATLRGNPAWGGKGTVATTIPFYAPVDAIGKDGIPLFVTTKSTGRYVNASKGRQRSNFRTYS